jgi:hypothetical protein
VVFGQRQMPRRSDELDKTNLSRLPGRKMIDSEVDRKPRTREEMEAESEVLRAVFVGISLPIPL